MTDSLQQYANALDEIGIRVLARAVTQAAFMQKALTRLIFLCNLATSQKLDREERYYKTIKEVGYKQCIFFRLEMMFESHGHVSSKTKTSCDNSLKMKTYGFRAVTRMWGGIVPP